ncbi:MAG: GGDEF domain-containing protein [Pseudomonadota bacterium]|nr:GGDEF domain-containing protein [Pseudomonadota bacterium]
MRGRLRTHYVLAWMTLLLIGGMLLIHAMSYAAFFQALTLPPDSVPQLQRVFLIHLSLMLILLVLILLGFGHVIYRDQRRFAEMAACDPLTDSLNQQTFEVIFKLLLFKAIRDNSPLCAILLNVDHLSQINQLHSRIAGDAVLHDMVGLIKNMQRRSDVIARWTDTEFIVLLPDCALDEAIPLAEQLRLRIRNHDFGLAKNWTVTFSAGVAEYTHGESEDEFLLRLEDALLRAKQHGRNRVESATSAFSTLLPLFNPPE